MNIQRFFLLLLAFVFSGCANSAGPHTQTIARTNVVLSEYKKIAVIKFQNPKNPASGHEAADILAIGFAGQGFNVVGTSQIAADIDQDAVYDVGLTPEIKSRLKGSGVQAIVVGTINQYFCSHTDKPPLLLKSQEDNHCSVTVTAKMMALETGEILWGTTKTDVEEGKWVTADSVMRSVLRDMQTTIPSLYVPLKEAKKAEANQPATPAVPSPPKPAPARP